MYINFQQLDQSKPCTQIYLQIIATCINLQLPIVVLKKKRLFRHAASYNVHVYQFLAKSGWYVDQSKTVHTYLFSKNRKLHKFATTNSNFEKKHNFFRYASS